MTAPSPQEPTKPPKDGLLCAMVLVPRTYARNRFFKLFDDPEYAQLRRRAKTVRGLIRELLGTGSRRAEIVGSQVLDDQVLIRVQVTGLNYARTTALSPLEAALVSFATHRARRVAVPTEDEQRVIRALEQLGHSALSLLGTT